jgi:PAS domain-containing protein
LSFLTGEPRTEEALLQMQIAELEEKIRQLEDKNRALNHRYLVIKSAINRNKMYIATKERMLPALSEEKIKQEKYFNLLLENTQELMLLLDHELQLVYCSDSFLRQMQIRAFSAVNGLFIQEVLFQARWIRMRLNTYKSDIFSDFLTFSNVPD